MRVNTETTPQPKKRGIAMIELIKEELAVAQIKEAETRAHGTERDWNRAYGAFLALQKLLDTVEKKEG